jgi:coenzyme F420-0:L-glutamate ligase/coenzyme F420-1:gamma-L-glutamate ligase
VASLCARALYGLPEVKPGDDLAALIVAAIESENPADPSAGPAPSTRSPSPDERPRPAGPPAEGQIIVIAHKAVSKVEGTLVALADVDPGPRALELAAAQGKDPRAVQVVLEESLEVLRAERGLLICRTHHGFVCANAGVDSSNASDEDTLVLLPRDPDASAHRIRARLGELMGAEVPTGSPRTDRRERAGADRPPHPAPPGAGGAPPAVLITDSFGRAWRHGQCDVAIGCAGMAPLDDWRGRSDGAGLELRATWLAIADAVAASADLARAKDSREPVVVIDGLGRYVTPEDGPGAAALVRPAHEDLFR